MTRFPLWVLSEAAERSSGLMLGDCWPRCSNLMQQIGKIMYVDNVQGFTRVVHLSGRT